MDTFDRAVWIAYLTGSLLTAGAAGTILVDVGLSFVGVTSSIGMVAAWAYCTLRSRDVWLEAHGSSVLEVYRAESERSMLSEVTKHCNDCHTKLGPDGCVQSSIAGPIYYCGDCCPRCSIEFDDDREHEPEPELDQDVERPQPA